MERTFIEQASSLLGQEIKISGWIYHYRAMAKTTFIVLRDCSGTVQIVASPQQLSHLSLKLEDVIEVRGKVRAEPRSKVGFEIDLIELTILNPAASDLPFHSSTDISQIGLETILEHRPLSLRSDLGSDIFKVQAKILEVFRSHLRKKYFTEIVSSKIVGSGTEGGTHLFELKYFERSAYLAQSPQFFKEHGVAGLERVFETGHVYRAEPHATSRHLTEYLSMDLEMGFIKGSEEIIQLEKELLGEIFESLNQEFGETFKKRSGHYLPDMMNAPIWEFEECLERLHSTFQRTDLVDDIDPLGERQLCEIAQKEFSNPTVFVLGYPLSSRPFYTHPRKSSSGVNNGAAQSFDLLFRGLEITTGGQRLHTRKSLEDAIRNRGLEVKNFESHLRMFELGMPPHGGLAIGLERLTAQIMQLSNVREATMYPRDRNRLSP